MSAAGYKKPERAKYMSKAEIAALLWVWYSRGQTPGVSDPGQAVNAYLMFTIQYLFGLRIGEVIRLRYEHLGPRDETGWPEFVNVPTLKKREGNSGVGRCKATNLPLYPVPVLSAPRLVLSAFNPQYRVDETDRKSPWLFPGRSNKTHLSPTQANNLFHVAKTEALLPDALSPHTLRHAAATHLYEKCRRRRVVTEFLRQSPGGGFSKDGGAAVTDRYIHVTPEQWRLFRGALDLPKLGPLANYRERLASRVARR